MSPLTTLLLWSSWVITYSMQAPTPAWKSRPTLPLVNALSAVPSDLPYCQAPKLTGHAYAALKSTPFTTAPAEEAELITTLVVIRHGDRSPIIRMPNESDVSWTECDAMSEVSSFKEPASGWGTHASIHMGIPEVTANPLAKNIWKGRCMPGQLTTTGAYQHMALGQELRKMYPSLRPKDVTVRTTYLWRTRESAQALLAGMFGGGWRTPVFEFSSYPIEVENMFPNQDACPALKKIYNDHGHRDEGYQSYWRNQTDLLSQLAPVFELHNDTGHASYKDQTFALVYDDLASRHCHGKPLPCSRSGDTCVTQDQAKRIFANGDYETLYAHKYSPYAKEMITLSIGTFLNELVGRLVAASTDTRPKPKQFQLFSGHDTTLIPLLGAFQAADEQLTWPPYASSLILELWRVKGDGLTSPTHYVRAFYNGQVLKVPFCDMLNCPLLDFLRHVEGYISRDPDVCAGASGVPPWA